jgi:hypothetical protein
MAGTKNPAITAADVEGAGEGAAHIFLYLSMIAWPSGPAFLIQSAVSWFR